MGDALSRVSLQEKGETKGLYSTMTSVHAEQIQKVIKGDKTLLFYIQLMLEDWSEHYRHPPMILRPFWQLKYDLDIEHSCITWKGMFFIPSVLRSKCLQAHPNVHPGITRIQLGACTGMYLPIIHNEIANHVQKCVPWQTIVSSQQKGSCHCN